MIGSQSHRRLNWLAVVLRLGRGKVDGGTGSKAAGEESVTKNAENGLFNKNFT